MKLCPPWKWCCFCPYDYHQLLEVIYEEWIYIFFWTVFFLHTTDALNNKFFKYSNQKLAIFDNRLPRLETRFLAKQPPNQYSSFREKNEQMKTHLKRYQCIKTARFCPFLNCPLFSLLNIDHWKMAFFCLLWY